MNKVTSGLVLSVLIFHIIALASAKPFLNNGPLSFSIFSRQAEPTPESHITKIPSKSAKLEESPTTEEAPSPGPSLVEHKINKVFSKILTISQLANTLRSAEQSENLEEDQQENEDGYTVEDSTNPPPSFVEQKIGKVVAKLFRLSQFASNIRERLNRPNYIFEYITGDNNGNETQEFTPDFDSYFNGQKDAEEVEGSEATSEESASMDVPDERKSKGHDFEGIEALKEEAANGEEAKSSEKGRKEKEETTPTSVEKKPKGSKEKGTRGKERDLIEEEAYRVYLFNREQLMKAAKSIDVSKDQNLLQEVDKSGVDAKNDSLITERGTNSTVTEGTSLAASEGGSNSKVPEGTSSVVTEGTNSVATVEDKGSKSTPKPVDFGKKKNSTVNVDFPLPDMEDGNMEGVLTTLKQTAEQVGYFVLEFFASFVGLTLGAVTQINHAFHQSNNTILVGIYNSTH